MSAPVTHLATGGNVRGTGASVRPSLPPSPAWAPTMSTPLCVALLIALGIATSASLAMYIAQLVRAFNGTATQATATAYTYTADHDAGGTWLWFGVTLACCVVVPWLVYALLATHDLEPLPWTMAIITLFGAFLLMASVGIVPKLAVEHNLSDHANQWLQQHLQTTYDVTNEIGSSNRFTEKLDSIDINGANVSFYLSRVDDTVLIRTVKP